MTQPKGLWTYFSTVDNGDVFNGAITLAFHNVLWSLSEHRTEKILNELTNLVDDTHALKDFSEHNLKRMSTREEDFEG
jgi:hypothetical protein